MLLLVILPGEKGTEGCFEVLPTGHVGVVLVVEGLHLGGGKQHKQPCPRVYRIVRAVWAIS